MKNLLILTILFLNISLTSTAMANDTLELSPIKPWPEFEATKTVVEERSTISKILLWPVNRVLDVIDIFKFDVGVGVSFGAVARFTKYGQVGYRQLIPASLRVGNFGRRSPIQLEYGAEIGAGPLFAESSIRETTAGEIGIGADLLVAGVYAGICLEEVADFATGIFMIDLMDDDI